MYKDFGLPQAWKYILLGFGLENLMLGGIKLCSKANTALIKLLIPEAPSA